MYTVSDFVIDRLIAWGVERIYGFPGDGIGAFDGSLGRADRADKPLTYIRPTHEELCALMATAHAKFTGTVGVCVATSSPGAFHMINGLYDAKMDNQPVVAIVGQQGLAAFGTDNQQENNLERTFSDVAAFVQTILTPMQAQVVVDKAFRVALTQLQPTVIILPHDVQSMQMEEPAKAPGCRAVVLVRLRLNSRRPHPRSARSPTSSMRAKRWLCWLAMARTVPPTRCWRSPPRPAQALLPHCAASRWSPPRCRTTPSSLACSARCPA